MHDIRTLLHFMLLHYTLEKLSHFTLKILLHFALVLHFAAILITFCVSITICGDYYILRLNTPLCIQEFIHSLRNIIFAVS